MVDVIEFNPLRNHVGGAVLERTYTSEQEVGGLNTDLSRASLSNEIASLQPQERFQTK